MIRLRVQASVLQIPALISLNRKIKIAVFSTVDHAIGDDVVASPA